MNAAILHAVGASKKIAYRNSFETIYLVSLAFGACAIIAAFLARKVDSIMTTAVSQEPQKTREIPPRYSDSEERASGELGYVDKKMAV